MTNPDEWARIHGRGSGKRVTYVRPLVASKTDRELPEEKVGKQVGGAR